MEQSNNQVLRLIQISDTHCFASDEAELYWSPLLTKPNQALKRVLKHINLNASDSAAIVVSGDLVQEENLSAYQRVDQLLQTATAPVYVLPGNHDIPVLMQTVFGSEQSSIHYQSSAQFGNWHCYFLDTSLPEHTDGHLDEKRLSDLKQWLENLPEQAYSLIFMHHHPVPIGSLWMDSHGLQQPAAFWQCISQHKHVKAISFGHIHQVFEGRYRTDEGHTIHIFGTPATCVQLSHKHNMIQFEHTKPAWREWKLYADGQLESHTYYLPEQGGQQTVPSQHTKAA